MVATVQPPAAAAAEGEGKSKGKKHYTKAERKKMKRLAAKKEKASIATNSSSPSSSALVDPHSAPSTFPARPLQGTSSRTSDRCRATRSRAPRWNDASTPSAPQTLRRSPRSGAASPAAHASTSPTAEPSEVQPMEVDDVYDTSTAQADIAMHDQDKSGPTQSIAAAAAAAAAPVADECHNVEADSDTRNDNPSCAGRKRCHDEAVGDDLMGLLLDMCGDDIDRADKATSNMMKDPRFLPILERWASRAMKDDQSKEVTADAADAADAVASPVMDVVEDPPIDLTETTNDGPSSVAKRRRRNLVDKTKAPELNNDAYLLNWDGTKRSSSCASSLRSVEKKKLKDALLKSVGQNDAQKALTLHDFLNDKDVVRYAKAAGYWPIKV